MMRSSSKLIQSSLQNWQNFSIYEFPRPACRLLRDRPVKGVWRIASGAAFCALCSATVPSPQGDSFCLAVSQAAVRLDAYLVSSIPVISRAKAQVSVKTGLVTVNGQPILKCSHKVQLGDQIVCRLPPPQASQAEPEDLPLQIVHEDEDILVINKAAGIVVHPSPGHFTGTLVNALLHHLQLPAVDVAYGHQPEGLPNLPGAELEAADKEIEQSSLSLIHYSKPGSAPMVRPGIVHRLDKGTTGLLVMAKNDSCHAQLCRQFMDRSVERTYVSILLGVPKPLEGLVETQIDRSPTDKLKMVCWPRGSRRGKLAVSTYKVLEELSSGRAALVQWRLKTGRTHQIRVHAKHIGHPLLCDETYAGGLSTVLNKFAVGHNQRRKLLEQTLILLDRPALHAKTLGFRHPKTGVQMQFTSDIPEDLQRTLRDLRSISLS